MALDKKKLQKKRAKKAANRFTLGKDGKPFFIAGPSDTPKKIEKILATLTKRCGSGRFDYMVGRQDVFDLDMEDEDELEDESDDEDDEVIEVGFVDVGEKEEEKKRGPSLLRPSRWYRSLFSR